MGTTQDSEITRQKLLHAAGELFAKKGFSSVTVREIVTVAQTHLSAMNYHFKSKDILYKEVLIFACKSSAITQEEQKYLEKRPPKEALYILIKEALDAYESKEMKWKITLIANETRQPSIFFKEIAQQYLQPDIHFIGTLIALVTSQKNTAPSVQFAAISLVGLIETFGLDTTFLEVIAPEFDTIKKKNVWYAQNILNMILQSRNPTTFGL